MTLKHTINITVSNFNLLYKAFFYFLIIAIIIGAIACVAIAPTVNDIKASLDESGFSVSFKEVFEKLLDGDKAFLDSIKEAVNDFSLLKDAIGGLKTELIGGLFIIFAFVLVFLFLYRLCVLPFTNIINQYMMMGNSFNFMSNYIAQLKESAAYAAISTLILTPITFGINFFCLYIAYILVKSISIFGLPVAFIIWVFLSSLKSALFCGWLPSMVRDEKNVFKALQNGIKAIGKKYGRIFLCYCSAHIILFVACNLLVTFTFGAGLLFIVPLIMLFTKTLELVIYYNLKNYHYYVDKNNVNTVSVYDEFKNVSDCPPEDQE